MIPWEVNAELLAPSQHTGFPEKGIKYAICQFLSSSGAFSVRWDACVNVRESPETTLRIHNAFLKHLWSAAEVPRGRKRGSKRENRPWLTSCMRAAGWKMSMKWHKKTDIAFFIEKIENRRKKMSENAVEWARARLNERIRAMRHAAAIATADNALPIS